MPETIGQLIQLQRLDLSSNQLTRIAGNQSDNLTQLQMLYLDKNQLTELPESLRKLKDIRSFTFTKQSKIRIAVRTVGRC